MMELLALKCPTCGQNLKPQSNEAVVVSCSNCKTAVSLHQSGIKAIDVKYAAPSSDNVEAWLPMWVFKGKVNITRRESQGSSKGADKDAARLWNAANRLFVPAWQEPVRQAREIGSRFTVHQPSLESIEPTENMVMKEATITPEDGLKLLDFIVLSLEAERKDWLEDLQFEIQTTGHELWAIPARETRSRWEVLIRG
jgi:DNA-directed RNA polymerase subunit M/transcription elongation factor TFIIS